MATGTETGAAPDLPARSLRFGWTTGACAAAAARAAAEALFSGGSDFGGRVFPSGVTIALPRGETPTFGLADTGYGGGETGEVWCEAAIEKDAGDDPDVTHGALIRARVWRVGKKAGLPRSAEPYKAQAEIAAGRIVLLAGDGVGIVSCPGLPVAVGEPAVNPAPRALLELVLADFVARLAADERLVVRLAIDGGEALATKTWNGRLGIRRGLSILGTTGVVRPFSCAAWIASIHRGVDVARALGHSHVIASTGSTSEATAQGLHNLPDTALLDMGDFVGGTLKYLRQHPIPRLTLAGGFGKLCKFAQGAGDLHSKRSQVSLPDLAERLSEIGAPDFLCEQIKAQPSAGAALALIQEADKQTDKQAEKQQCGNLAQALTQSVARSAYDEALRRLEDAPVAVEVLIVARDGSLLASYADHAEG